MRAGLNPNPVVDRRADALPGSKVLLGCLNRDVFKQKLNLIQLAARTPTEPRTGSSQIVRCKGGNADFRSGRPNYVPYGLFADSFPEHATRTADPAKDLTTIDGSRTQPANQLPVDPIRHRDRANMTALANKIHDGPVFLSLLQVFDSEIHGLVSSQSAGQQKSQQGTVTFAFHPCIVRALP